MGCSRGSSPITSTKLSTIPGHRILKTLSLVFASYDNGPCPAIVEPSLTGASLARGKRLALKMLEQEARSLGGNALFAVEFWHQVVLHPMEAMGYILRVHASGTAAVVKKEIEAASLSGGSRYETVDVGGWLSSRGRREAWKQRVDTQARVSSFRK